MGMQRRAMLKATTAALAGAAAAPSRAQTQGQTLKAFGSFHVDPSHESDDLANSDGRGVYCECRNSA